MTDSRDDTGDAEDADDTDDRDWPIFEGLEVFKGRSRDIRIDEERSE